MNRYSNNNGNPITTVLVIIPLILLLAVSCAFFPEIPSEENLSESHASTENIFKTILENSTEKINILKSIPKNVPQAVAYQGPAIFQVQQGTPQYIPNWLHADQGCGWIGVAGQVFNRSGKEELGLIVKLRGTYNGKLVDLSSISGSAPAYGPGGYEIAFGSTLVDSVDSLHIQIFDNQGNTRSSPINFRTFSESATNCTRNLVIINCTEIEFTETYFLPIIAR